MTKQYNDAWRNWCSGFVDGEGHFSINIHDVVRQKYRPRFKLDLRLDDFSILQEMQSVLGGNLRIYKPTYNMLKARPGGKPQGRWNILDKKGMTFLVKHFRKYPLRTKKQRDQQIWAMAVEEYYSPSKSQEKMAEYKKALEIVKIYQSPDTIDNLLMELDKYPKQLHCDFA